MNAAVTTDHAPAPRLAAVTLEASYPPRREAAAEMRQDLRALLARRAVDAALAFDVVLAADEAFANALAHAGGPTAAIRVSATVTRSEATVEVRDGGDGFVVRRPDPRPFPDVSRPCGRGVFLIERVMDEVSIRSGRGGTTVRMVRRLA